MGQDNDRHLAHANSARGQQACMACDDYIIRANQHRVHKTELADVGMANSRMSEWILAFLGYATS